MRLLVTRKFPPDIVRLERVVPVIVMFSVVLAVKSKSTFPELSVKTRRIPSLLKLNTLLVDEPLVQVNTCPFVPVLLTVNVAPRRPVTVKLGTRVIVSPVAAIKQFVAVPPHVIVTVPENTADPIEQSPNVRVIRLLAQVPKVVARAQVVAYELGTAKSYARSQSEGPLKRSNSRVLSIAARDPLLPPASSIEAMISPTCWPVSSISVDAFFAQDAAKRIVETTKIILYIFMRWIILLLFDVAKFRYTLSIDD